jgi:alkylated DNA repair protein (DNA oxidative demethylase)
MNDLFGALDSHRFVQEELAPGAIMLRGKALPSQDSLLAEIETITNKAPFRNMVTPGGYVMSVAMTNCGAAGWVTDRSGYRYDRLDPESGRPWPALPDCFLRLAISAAAEAGYLDFVPDACLRRPQTRRSGASLHASTRRHRGLGWPIPPALSWRSGVERWCT